MRADIMNYLGGALYEIFEKADRDFFEDVEEIRIRVGKPVVIKKGRQEITLNHDGEKLTNVLSGYRPNTGDIRKTVELMSEFSLYSYEDELKNGYITLPGGHRVGLCGKTVVENGRVKTISYISGLNIRFSHEIKGCSDKVIQYLKKSGLGHILIISPPACGKTTLLRDLVRQVSDGNIFGGKTVGIVDERSEIAGCYMGIPQNDVGIRSDVLDGCPKAEGMLMLLRSMAPDIIAVDEVGKTEDIYAIEEVLNGGIKLFCTVHGSSLEDVMKKPVLGELIGKKIFDTFIVLSYETGPGHIKGIFDSNLKAVNYNVS